MKQRKSMDKTKKLCQAIPAQLKDEDLATVEYLGKAKEARKLNHPAGEEIAIIYEKLAMDELSHREALAKLAKAVCSI
jgi:rubrerythrin